jgi:glycosyltransferase involved in cell wall biosynthesis
LIRIIQLIDSLEIGGAEKMAVNYANALAAKLEFSGLVTTRKEGNLKSKIDTSVNYLFLERKGLIDLKAIFKLKRFCKTNRVTHIQAHSSSFFTAVLIKILLFEIKIIWHDHNGLSEFLSTRKNIVLKFSSLFFEGIIVVNDQLLQWATNTLFCKKIIYLANFTVLEENQIKVTNLRGTDGNRIICVANLRYQKNHLFLVEVAKIINNKFPDWSFHLIGKDFQDNYSFQLKSEIKKQELKDAVFLYDSVQDVQNCITQSEIAIITSQSEGLPLVLLEYGLLEKPVIATAVGEIPKIITNEFHGYLVEKSDVVGFASYLEYLIENTEQRKYLAHNLNTKIKNEHGEQEIISQFLKFISF